jgi:hypothetical protein
MSDAVWIVLIVCFSVFLFPLMAGFLSEVFGKQNKSKKYTQLEQTLKDLQEQQSRQYAMLEKRLTNLETIITSQTWDVLQDSKLTSEEKKFLTQSLGSELEELKNNLGDSRKVELLAARLK